MVSQSLAMQKIKAYLNKVASTDSTVLITGETGTGKEMVAQLIHHNSPRRHKPFVCINCAAIPDSLLESELFGYGKGAFTGANALREGKLRIAEGGTIFFDEVGEMSLAAQTKILRAVESREIYRIGGQSSIPLNLRVLAATNRDLRELVTEGKFRVDLYYRLKVVSVHLPPLRDRRDEIPALLTYYLREQQRLGHEARAFDEEVLDALLLYDWPGNVRELKNFVEAVGVNRPSGLISMHDLPEEFARCLRTEGTQYDDERARVLSALMETNWRRTEAAQRLRWSRMTLYRKMVKYNLDKEEKKNKLQRLSQSPVVTPFVHM
jgi:transcriptional regulator with PAS, ATPase and Fis domain